jgi:hypothetical protein
VPSWKLLKPRSLHSNPRRAAAAVLVAAVPGASTRVAYVLHGRYGNGGHCYCGHFRLGFLACSNLLAAEVKRACLTLAGGYGTPILGAMKLFLLAMI